MVNNCSGCSNTCGSRVPYQGYDPRCPQGVAGPRGDAGNAGPTGTSGGKWRCGATINGHVGRLCEILDDEYVVPAACFPDGISPGASIFVLDTDSGLLFVVDVTGDVEGPQTKVVIENVPEATYDLHIFDCATHQIWLVKKCNPVNLCDVCEEGDCYLRVSPSEDPGELEKDGTIYELQADCSWEETGCKLPFEFEDPLAII